MPPDTSHPTCPHGRNIRMCTDCQNRIIPPKVPIPRQPRALPSRASAEEPSSTKVQAKRGPTQQGHTEGDDLKFAIHTTNILGGEEANKRVACHLLNALEREGRTKTARPSKTSRRRSGSILTSRSRIWRRRRFRLHAQSKWMPRFWITGKLQEADESSA